ncbi:MAG: protein of unassigned function, partial [Devosia sp.]|nr:protein of unassigned function [Devosia sp.]
CYIAFYAGPMDRCAVGGEIVTLAPGNFYGGWDTPGIVRQFKGEPGADYTPLVWHA